MTSLATLRHLVVAGALIVVLAACSSALGPTPLPTTTPTSAPPSSLPTPTSIPATAPSTTSAALQCLDLPNNANELKALLPDTLGGATLGKFSGPSSDLPGSPIRDASIAAAQALNIFGHADGQAVITVWDFRCAGVDHTILIATFKTLLAAAVWTSGTVGGNSVETASAPGGTNYVYGDGDIMFWVSTKDATLAAEALSHLP
jgi:hypothetical protein